MVRFSDFLVNNVNRPNVETSENRLLDLAVAGDREARRALFDQYRAVVYRVAFRITGRDADALDVVQDGFIQAFERLNSFNRDAGFKTWLLRIVSNKSLDLLRKRKVRLAVPLDRPDDDGEASVVVADGAAPRPSDGLERAELGQQLQAAIDRLPPDQKAVFAMFAVEELSYGEIAETLGIPIGTVMSRLYHARRRLQATLKELAPIGTGRPRETNK
jgi:RNA polymerase sigma-70 factor (ECF subfamily)